MVSFLGLIGLIIAVFWCRGYIQKHLQGISRLMGLTAKGGLTIYTIIFFPGIILHEMSHFLMAALLGVRTGEINLIPRFEEISRDNPQTALGSVQVAKSDALRGSLIGAAPFFSGSLCLYVIVNKYFMGFQIIRDSFQLTWKGSFDQPFLMLLWLYLIFVIANTMFSSKEDTHSWPLIFILAVILVILGYVSGTLNGAIAFLWPMVLNLTQILLGAMGFTALLDGLMIAGLIITEKTIEKLLKKRVRYG